MELFKEYCLKKSSDVSKNNSWLFFGENLGSGSTPTLSIKWVSLKHSPYSTPISKYLLYLFVSLFMTWDLLLISVLKLGLFILTSMISYSETDK